MESRGTWEPGTEAEKRAARESRSGITAGRNSVNGAPRRKTGSRILARASSAKNANTNWRCCRGLLHV